MRNWTANLLERSKLVATLHVLGELPQEALKHGCEALRMSACLQCICNKTARFR